MYLSKSTTIFECSIIRFEGKRKRFSWNSTLSSIITQNNFYYFWEVYFAVKTDNFQVLWVDIIFFKKEWDLIETVLNQSSLIKMFQSTVPPVNALLGVLKSPWELALMNNNFQVTGKLKKEENKGHFNRKYFGSNLCLPSLGKLLWGSSVLNAHLTVKILRKILNIKNRN